MARVYFKRVCSGASDQEISQAAGEVLEALITGENMPLASRIPMKLHFGEKGNLTYLKPACYDGVISFLEARGIQSEFCETSVLYGGERFSREKHMRLAASHGFTRLPVVIADGSHGEDAVAVPVNLHHFRTCAIARKLAEAEQVLVCSHFKGHALAGFGGAIKQLSMGFAAKGGKLAMHMSVKPSIRRWFCKGCGACVSRCQNGAITIRHGTAYIDHRSCIGCGACFSICRHHGVSIFTWRGICNIFFRRNVFREKLAEYAYASSRGKRHIYLNFAVNITNGCDCEPRPMFRTVPNVGIYGSLDPVAADRACYDAVAADGRKFKGLELLAYAEKIGVGTEKYEIVSLD